MTAPDVTPAPPTPFAVLQPYLDRLRAEPSDAILSMEAMEVALQLIANGNKPARNGTGQRLSREDTYDIARRYCATAGLRYDRPHVFTSFYGIAQGAQ